MKIALRSALVVVFLAGPAAVDTVAAENPIAAAPAEMPAAHNSALVGEWSGSWEYLLGSNLRRLDLIVTSVQGTEARGSVRFSYWGGRTTVAHYNRDLKFTGTVDHGQLSFVVPDGPEVRLMFTDDRTLEGEIAGQTGGHAVLRKVK